MKLALPSLSLDPPRGRVKMMASICVETNALWESRALRPGEGRVDVAPRVMLALRNTTLPGRYRVRPTRKREGGISCQTEN